MICTVTGSSEAVRRVALRLAVVAEAASAMAGFPGKNEVVEPVDRRRPTRRDHRRGVELLDDPRPLEPPPRRPAGPLLPPRPRLPAGAEAPPAGPPAPPFLPPPPP